jgi:hypothetical protein
MRHVDSEGLIWIEVQRCLMVGNAGRDSGQGWSWLHIYCRRQGCLDKEGSLARWKGVLLHGISLHKDTSVVIDALASICVMKEGSMGPPDRYLGANIDKVQTQDGKVMWTMHSGDYCKAAIANLEKTLTADGKSLSQYGDGKRPYLSTFHPEIDTSAELDDNGFHEYQHHIGVLRWAIELGRINIMTEVSCLSQHLCAP